MTDSLTANEWHQVTNANRDRVWDSLPPCAQVKGRGEFYMFLHSPRESKVRYAKNAAGRPVVFFRHADGYALMLEPHRVISGYWNETDRGWQFECDDYGFFDENGNPVTEE